MSELVTKRLSIVPTMRCTLKCKLCSNHMPNFVSPTDVTAKEMMRDIDLIFELFDRVEWLQFVGGEIFLNRQMAEVYYYCHQYEKMFDKIILETNATLIPRQEELKVLEEFGDRVKIMISDYGFLSRHRDENIKLFNEHNIPFILKKYYDADQHFGGWIDNTGLHNYGESEEEIFMRAAKCPQVKIENMHCYKGKLHRCSNSLFMTELGVVTPNPGDFLNLLDSSLSYEKKREIVLNFYRYPRKSCGFCNWKNAESLQRYPAAEQVN